MNPHPVRAPEGATDTGEPEGRAASATRRLLPLVLPVWLLGGAAVVGAGWSFAAARPSLAVLGGVLALLAAAALAEAFPVPLESLPAGHVSLAATFVVGTAVIYGWAPATLIAFLTRVLLELYQRRPAIRLAYNGAMYALGGAATGLAVALVPDRHGVGWLMAAVLVGATAFYAINILLVAAVIARWAGEPFPPLLARTAYWTSVPFGIMASVSLMLQVLWERSPLLAAALVGPLIAIVLYQRSVHRALAAMRLALTDPLTGLGNHRHFHERLQGDLAPPGRRGVPARRRRVRARPARPRRARGPRDRPGGRRPARGGARRGRRNDQRLGRSRDLPRPRDRAERAHAPRRRRALPRQGRGQEPRAPAPAGAPRRRGGRRVKLVADPEGRNPRTPAVILGAVHLQRFRGRLSLAVFILLLVFPLVPLGPSASA